MARQVCVIGLGQFGSHMARMLVRLGCEVLAIDVNERRVEAVRDDVHRAIVGDARSAELLQSVLSSSVDEAVICLGERHLEASILCALHLKRVGVKSIRSTAINEDHAQILQAVGATRVIFPEQEAAERAARLIANPHIVDMFPLTEDFRVVEIVAPRGTHGRTLAQVRFRASFDILVLAIRRPGDEHFAFMPHGDTVIQAGETLMVLGRELDLARFEAYDRAE